MYTVTVESGFKAEHQLTFSDGRIEPLHSHDWIVRVAVSTEKLDEMGLAVDFNDLKKTIEMTVEPLDGATLEKLDIFESRNTSAENVAKYIYDQTRKLLGGDIHLDYAEVMEEAGCWARYSS